MSPLSVGIGPSVVRSNRAAGWSALTDDNVIQYMYGGGLANPVEFNSDLGHFVVRDEKGDSIRQLRDGRVGTGDGSADYASGDQLTSTSAITTLSAVAEFDVASNPGAWASIASEYVTAGSKRKFLIWMDVTGYVYVDIYADGAGLTYKSYGHLVDLADGVRHTLGFTWDNGTLKLYVDGSEVTPSKGTDDAFTEIDALSGGKFSINGAGTGGSYFPGDTHTVLVTSDVMTAQEMSDWDSDHTLPDNRLGLFWLEEEAATNDICLNAADPTKNLTWLVTLADIHQSSTAVTYSAANERGYSLGSVQEYRTTPTNSDWSGTITDGSSIVRIKATFYNDIESSNQKTVFGNKNSSPRRELWVGGSGLLKYYYGTGTLSSTIACDLGWNTIDVTINAGVSVEFTVNGVSETVLGTPSAWSGNNFALWHFNGGDYGINGIGRNVEVLDSGDVSLHNWALVKKAATDTDNVFVDSVAGNNATCSVDGDVAIIPASASDATVDVSGLATTHQGRAEYYGRSAAACWTSDAANDHVVLPQALLDALSGASALSVSVRCNPVSTGMAVALDDGDINEVIGFDLAGNVLYATVNGFNTNFGYVSYTPDSEEHTFTFVFDGGETEDATRLKVWIDGVQQTLTFNGTIGATADSGQTNGYIGRYFSNYRAGRYRQVAFWSDALTESEVLAVHNSATYPSDNLEGHYPLSEGGGDLYHDISGNERHAVGVGSATDPHANTQTVDDPNQRNGFSLEPWFDGVSGRASTGVTRPTSGKLTFEFTLNADRGGYVLAAGAGGWGLWISATNTIEFYTTGASKVTSTVAAVDGGHYKAELEWIDSTSWSLSINDETPVTDTTHTPTAPAVIAIGSDSTPGFYLSCSVRYVTLFDTDNTTELNDWRARDPNATFLADSVGTDDANLTGTYAIVEIPGNAGLEPDGVTAVQFPAGSAGTAGKWGPSKSQLDMTGGVSTPFANRLSLETDYEWGDVRVMQDPVNQKYRRTRDDGDDRITTLAEPAV